MREKKVARTGKLFRYAANAISDNIIDPAKESYDLQGNWNLKYFKNDHPITVELACGRGEYTVGLAKAIPQRNYIGVDLKGDRIFVGSQQAQTENLNNVAFVRSRIELISTLFSPGEVDEVWLTFPDPRPRERDEKHRLTNIHYLNLYRSILQPYGWFRFKTDNTDLFNYTLECLTLLKTINLEFTYDLYQSHLIEDHHGLKTKYEKIWSDKGESIKYLKFQFVN